MSAEDYFQGFDETRYDAESKERWGNTFQYAESQRKWAGYPKEQKDAIKAEGARLTRRMIGDDPSLSPDDPDVQTAIGEYLAYINKYFYTCDVGYLRGLAHMWLQDPRFTTNYERIREGGAEFVREPINIYCERHDKSG